MIKSYILILIENAAAARGYAPATLSKKAVGNQSFYRRLQEGRTCSLEMLDRLIAWLQENPVSPKGTTHEQEAERSE